MILVTGGAGFIGRGIVKRLLSEGRDVCVLDDLSNGRMENIEDFSGKSAFRFIKGDIRDRKKVEEAFRDCDACIHAAAAINVQESIDDPLKYHEVNVEGTFNVLEEARKKDARLSVIGTCMVYDLSGEKAISEGHPVLPKSPYAGSKLAAENMALSYFHAYGLPVSVLRPFNTYGPHQKSNMEGGVISVFIKACLEGRDVCIFGDGKQTRDFLYVDDCADFIVKASFSEKAVGETINAGSGRDISINDLASLICKDKGRIKHVKHHHPQSEIQKLLCDPSKARSLLGWTPKVSLEEGIAKTRDWLIKSGQ